MVFLSVPLMLVVIGVALVGCLMVMALYFDLMRL